MTMKMMKMCQTIFIDKDQVKTISFTLKLTNLSLYSSVPTFMSIGANLAVSNVLKVR